MIADLSNSERETLKAIYRQTKDGGEAHTGMLAEALGVSPGTSTTTVKRLADRALVDHRPYQGVSLTDAGRRSAVALIRRHRIVERFLADMLGYAWNEADALAPQFEHDLPDEVLERLFVALHRPETCPHGFPIPVAGQDVLPELPELYELEPGDEAEVAVPGATDREVVRFLETLGVVPDVHVVVVEKHPFDGPMVLRVGDQDRTLGEKVARQVHVRRVVRGRGEGDERMLRGTGRTVRPEPRDRTAAPDADGTDGATATAAPDGGRSTTRTPASGKGAARKKG